MCTTQFKNNEGNKAQDDRSAARRKEKRKIPAQDNQPPFSSLSERKEQTPQKHRERRSRPTQNNPSSNRGAHLHCGAPCGQATNGRGLRQQPSSPNPRNDVLFPLCLRLYLPQEEPPLYGGVFVTTIRSLTRLEPQVFVLNR